MQEFGWTNPVLIDGENGIIAGHGRVLAAETLGLQSAPCIELRHLTEAQRRAYILADNQLALLSDWDEALLAQEVAQIAAAGGSPVDLGFDLGWLDSVLSQPEDPQVPSNDPDAVPALTVTPVSRTGDVWVLGPHRVMCGDSTVQSDVDTLLSGTLCDVCWTDPPYNVAYKGRAGTIANDDMSDAAFNDFLLRAYTCMFAALRSGGAIYVAHADTEGYAFRSGFARAGFKLAGCLVWKKQSLVLGRSDYQWIHEPLLYGWKPGAAHQWFGGRKQTTVLPADVPGVLVDDAGRYTLQVGDDILEIHGPVSLTTMPTSVVSHAKPARNGEHPTMKPVGLIERMLRNSARAGDVVLDLFGGSGSTLIAAHNQKMAARLMELDPRFVDVIVRRWQEYTGLRAHHAQTGRAFDSSLEG
jgi:DNA modification methylase